MPNLGEIIKKSYELRNLKKEYDINGKSVGIYFDHSGDDLLFRITNRDHGGELILSIMQLQELKHIINKMEGL